MPIKALILDFDSTISVPTFLERKGQWAVADNVQLFNSMSKEEQIANFGGAKRIEQLASVLRELKAASVELFVISIGYKAAYVPHLRTAGLLDFFPSHTPLFTSGAATRSDMDGPPALAKG